MQSRHSFNVTVALAIGFGATLSYAVSSSTAVGFPTGPAVSMGANPIWAEGGEVDGTTLSVLTAPAADFTAASRLWTMAVYQFNAARIAAGSPSAST